MINIQEFPSVIQNHAHSKLTQKYKFVPTTQLVEDLSRQGWQLSAVQEKTTRLASRQGFQKHLLRFRHSNYNLDLRDKLVPEIIVTNSHDGTAAFQLMAGIFRVICSNGLIVASNMFGSYLIKHIGYTIDKVAEATADILKIVPQVAGRISEFETIELTPDERGVYAAAAVEIKYGKPDRYNVDEVLRAHRKEDKDFSLWSTYNVVQENLIKGGEYRIGRRGLINAAGINSIDRNVAINRALWAMTERMAELKNQGLKITNN